MGRQWSLHLKLDIGRKSVRIGRHQSADYFCAESMPAGYEHIDSLAKTSGNCAAPKLNSDQRSLVESAVDFDTGAMKRDLNEAYGNRWRPSIM
jgi:hypothetical protein